MKLKDQVAIITGAGSGIGRASALTFAKEGAVIIIADKDEEKGRRVVEEVIDYGGQARFVKTDVSVPSEVKRLVNHTYEKYHRVDILYNNAGIPQTFQMTEDIDEDFVDKILSVNVKGPFLGTKYAIPIMKRQKRGVILFTSSMTGVRPMPGTNLYATTKGAEITMTKALAIELAEFHIRVNAIAPVAVESPMLDHFILEEDKKEGRQKLIERFPLGRLITPEEVAATALYLASDNAEMITGSVIQLDGGRGV